MRQNGIKNMAIVISLCALSLVLLSLYSITEPKSKSTDENFLDGCYHVYLDMGSHNGTQIRKLYEPEYYPLAEVRSIFDEHFGPVEERRDGARVVCAVGFEPNYRLTKHLKAIEHSYTKCGWRVKFFTETAVSDHDGTERFYTDGWFDIKNSEISAGILPPEISLHTNEKVNKLYPSKNITSLRLSKFLLDVVGKRKLPLLPPSKEHPPRVLIKMDIEGSEVDVIPDLIFTGALQHINLLMIEWHERLEKLSARKNAHSILNKTIGLLSEYSSSMKRHGAKFDFNSVNLDDESYGLAEAYGLFKLPNC